MVSVGPSVVRGQWFVLKYLRECSLFLSNLLHEVRVPQGYKSDRAQFLRKNPGVTNGQKTFLGHFFVFLTMSLHSVINVSLLSYTKLAQHYLTLTENSMSRKNQDLAA